MKNSCSFMVEKPNGTDRTAKTSLKIHGKPMALYKNIKFIWF